jgi:type IV secretion system protein VirD4
MARSEQLRSSTTTPGEQIDPVAVMALLMVLGALLAFAWSAPVLAAWIHSGRVVDLSISDAFEAVSSGQVFGSDPASAYPPAQARAMPGQAGFWTGTALLGATIATLLFAAYRAAEIRMSRPTADPRPWQLKGRKPHDFGRFRTVQRELVVPGPSPARVIVGEIGWPKALLAITEWVQMAVIAAPRTGKSSGLVIPAILEHEGPVVTTSVRTDIAENTLARRRRLGRVFVWDPFGARSDCWDMLQGCERWEHALMVARWLGQANPTEGGENSQYFAQEAEGLLAPYLHAAALTPDLTSANVYNWILSRDVDAASRILADVGAEDARERLTSVYSYSDRQRDAILGTAAVQLKAYGHPAAARTAKRGEGMTPEALFEGPNTLYIVASREHQQLLAPLVVTMISAMLQWISERENRTGSGLKPAALFALDETASIAPIKDLPQILATSLGSGARFLTVWHSVAQIQRHFGNDAAAEILALSQAKLFMGSITDQFTRQEVVELLGRRQAGRQSREPGRQVEIMTAQVLQRTSTGEGLLINAELPPVIFNQRRYYLDRHLRELMGEAVPLTAASPGSDGIANLDGAVAS